MTPARTGDDGTYVDVSVWTDDPVETTGSTPPDTDTADTADTAAAPAVPATVTRRRKPWLFAALGVLLGLGIVWGVWSLGDDPTSRLPSDHPPTNAPAAAATPTPLTAEQWSALKAKVDADPTSLDDRLVYGVALYNEGRYPEAEEQWLAATELAPDDPGPWYNLGFLYLSLDPPSDEKAEAAWRKVVEIAPGTSMAETVTQHLDRLDTVLPGGAAPSPSPTPDQ
ncbi:tetratricopeptide repeat protein [Propioniciclava sinopodophylli]|uniref:tetratricopeptide repeat protein n=1 Tax=Propioniciclava sinopodophylli TaxID=1837344 RepID=UPI002491FD81|nr:tetratricopeptide repeat protein [Propioniciclava sinopodophylli]